VVLLQNDHRLRLRRGEDEEETPQLASFAKVAVYCRVGDELNIGFAGGPLPRGLDGKLLNLDFEDGSLKVLGILSHAWEQTQQGGRNKGPMPREYLWTYDGPPQRELPSTRGDSIVETIRREGDDPAALASQVRSYSMTASAESKSACGTASVWASSIADLPSMVYAEAPRQLRKEVICLQSLGPETATASCSRFRLRTRGRSTP